MAHLAVLRPGTLRAEEGASAESSNALALQRLMARGPWRGSFEEAWVLSVTIVPSTEDRPAVRRPPEGYWFEDSHRC